MAGLVRLLGSAGVRIVQNTCLLAMMISVSSPYFKERQNDNHGPTANSELTEGLQCEDYHSTSCSSDPLDLFSSLHCLPQQQAHFAGSMLDQHQMLATYLGAVQAYVKLPIAMLQTAQGTYKTSSRILRSLEEFFGASPGQPSETTSVSGQQLAIRLFRVPTNLSYRSERLTARRLRIGGTISIDKQTTASEFASSRPLVDIAIPNGITSRVDGFNDSVPLQVVIFDKDSTQLFLERENRPGDLRHLASAVVNVNVGRSGVSLNDSFVEFNFTTTASGSRPICVFWDFDMDGGFGGWNDDGCATLQDVNAFVKEDDVVQCRCNHLTHFGVMLDIWEDGISDTDRYILERVTLTGNILNVACVSLLILTMLVFRKFREEARTKILLQLLMAMTMSSSCLVLSSDEQVRQRKTHCIVIAILLHYFPLSSLFWTLVEAFLLHRAFVGVYSEMIHHFFLKSCVFAWGVPAIFIVCTMAACKFSIETYNVDQTDYCRLSATPYYITFITPAAFIITINLVFYVKICCEIHKKSESVNHGHMHLALGGESFQCHRSLRKLVAGISIAFLLGLQWLVGFFLLLKPPVVFYYIFAFVHCLAGTIIFIGNVVLRTEVRNAWSKRIRNSSFAIAVVDLSPSALQRSHSITNTLACSVRTSTSTHRFSTTTCRNSFSGSSCLNQEQQLACSPMSTKAAPPSCLPSQNSYSPSGPVSPVFAQASSRSNTRSGSSAKSLSPISSPAFSHSSREHVSSSSSEQISSIVTQHEPSLTSTGSESVT